MSQVLKIGVITGTHTERINPGDLITAEFMNTILARLDAIEDRLTKIEDSLGNIQPPQPTFTLPTTFTPTLTFHPTFTLPTFFTPTFTTFFPTLTFTQPTFTTRPTAFHPTVLTPSEFPSGGMGTFVATFVRPTQSFDFGQEEVVTVPAEIGIFPPETDVTFLPNIGAEEKAALDKAGIKNVRDVSMAEPKLLADTLKINMDSAKNLSGLAGNVLKR
jgi:hypothetical protein